MSAGHLASHIKHPEMKSDNTLHVIGVVSNPARWHSRIRLFKKWRDEMLKTPNVKLYVVEGVFGDHHGECAPEEGQDYQYMQVKLDRTELWLKENMLNIGVRNLFPKDWKYMCWCDTDIHFRNPNWAFESIKQMQIFHVLQPWSQGTALLPDGSARLPIDSSFGFLHTTNRKKSHGHHKINDGYAYAHSGYAWCCTRYFWENVGGLIDFCLIGSGDHHMAWGMIDRVAETIHGSMHPDYKDMVLSWAKKAQHACAGMIGYVAGIIEHGFHGGVKGRDYGGRWGILVDIGFNPKSDIAYDSQGVIYYKGPQKKLLQQRIVSYNRTRNEDGTDA